MNKNFALVENSLVTNIIVIDDADAASIAGFGAIPVPEGAAVAQGWSYSAGVFAAPVIPPKTLAEVKTDRAAFIDKEYERVNQLPIVYLGNTFQADNASTDLMDKAISTLTAIGGTTGITWWTVDNVGVALTYAEFAGLSAAILGRGQPYFANKRAKKDLIDAATTTAQVEAITW